MSTLFKFCYISILITSCSHTIPEKKDKEKLSIPSIFNSRVNYKYTDLSGSFQLDRLSYRNQGKLLLQSQMILAGESRAIEERRVVSKMGYANIAGVNAGVIRPMISHFKAVFEGEEKFTQLKLDLERQKMIVRLEKPFQNFEIVSDYEIPSSLYLCFFSQIPDCLKHYNILNPLLNEEISSFQFWIVWESFPYNEFLYSEVSNEVFSLADLKYDGSATNEHRFTLEVQGQVISYHFDSNGKLLKMNWVAQGMSMVHQGRGEHE